MNLFEMGFLPLFTLILLEIAENALPEVFPLRYTFHNLQTLTLPHINMLKSHLIAPYSGLIAHVRRHDVARLIDSY